MKDTGREKMNNFSLPLYGGIVPPRPTVTITPENIIPQKTPKPKRIIVKIIKRYFLLGFAWNETYSEIYIFIPMLCIAITVKKRRKTAK
jgi:hypothetical protein